jgi:hypothetical protein
MHFVTIILMYFLIFKWQINSWVGTLVVAVFRRLRQEDHLSPGVQRQPGQHRDPLSLKKQ